MNDKERRILEDAGLLYPADSRRKMNELPQELLEMIARDPRAFLRRNYRTEDRIRIKRQRLKHLEEISTTITQTVKAAAAYTGPGDKVGDSAAAIADLKDEISTELEELGVIQQETALAIRLLVTDTTLRALLEAYYLSGMRWEEIAYTMHYAYRWVQRLHRKALSQMKSEARSLCNLTSADDSELQRF